MKSTARIGEHPIHPMVVPYPFAFLSGAWGFRLLARARGNDALERTADHLRTAGLLSSIVAAVPGVIDYFGSVPDGPPKRTATLHAISNSSALVCFTAAAAAAYRGSHTRDIVTRFESIGTAFLCLGGWLGGHLSYHHHVGVVEEHEPGKERATTRELREEAEALENVGP
jgi:uncharacterized membrane protein